MTTEENPQESAEPLVEESAGQQQRKPEDDAAAATEQEYVDPAKLVEQLDKENAEQEASAPFEPPLNATKDGYALEVPALLTASQRPQVQELAEDFGRAAKDAGLAGSEAQVLLDFVIGHAQQEVEGLNLANEAECRTRVANLYGPMAKPLIEAAQAGYAKLPQPVKDWLDAPNDAGERNTNSPAVLAMLALWHGGYSKLSPAAAAKELQQIRSGKDYGSKTDRLQQDKLALLGLIASRGKSGDSKALAAKTTAPSVKETSAIDKRMSEIRRDPHYYQKDNNPKLHKALVAEMSELYKQRGGGR